jgi:hypothetical protein
VAFVLGAALLPMSASWAAVPPVKQARSTDVYKLAIDRSVSLNDAADSVRRPQLLKDRINEVRQSLVEIMQAGAKGEL